MRGGGLTTAISLTSSARCCSKTVGVMERDFAPGVVDILVVGSGARGMGWSLAKGMLFNGGLRP